MRVALAVVVAALALVAAGCGGSSSPEEDWANSVCTQLKDWRGQIDDISGRVRDEIKSPSAETPTELQASATEAVNVTRQAASDLQAIGAPPGAQGDEAKQLIDSLANSVRSAVDTIKQQTQKLTQASSAQEVVTTVAAASSQLSGAVAQGRSTLDSISELSSNLKDGIDNAGACKDLRGD